MTRIASRSTTRCAPVRKVIAAWCAWLVAGMLVTGGCGESEETPIRDVFFEGQLAQPRTFETDLGYAVEIVEVQLAVADLEFTAGGAVHDKRQRQLAPDAAYHPGHIQGGQVLGEYPGRQLVKLVADSVFTSGETFGLSSVHYDAVNFEFWTSAELTPANANIEPSAVVRGTVTVDDEPVPFEFSVAMESNDRVFGVPFAVDVPRAGDVTVVFEFHPIDPIEGKTLLDGVDFGALETDDGQLVLASGTASYNRVRNTLRRHDHYVFTLRVE